MTKNLVSIVDPVEIKFSSREFVAWQLMKLISDCEANNNQKLTRDYWLDLYRQCWHATSGTFMESALKEEQQS